MTSSDVACVITCNSASFLRSGFAMGIDLSGQSNLPDFVEEIVRAWGLAAINWGRMEQTLELLLVQVNSPEYKTSEAAPVPTTSFRLKVEKFERIFAKHPLMSAVHHIAKPVCIGLKKANKSRIPLTHCSVKNFDAGPPGTVQIQTIKRRARPNPHLEGSVDCPRADRPVSPLAENLERLSEDHPTSSIPTTSDNLFVKNYPELKGH